MKTKIRLTRLVLPTALAALMTGVVTAGTGRIMPGQARMDSANMRQQKSDEMRARRDRFKELSKDYGIKKALGVTDQQWQVIEPRLQEVQQLMTDGRAVIGISVFGGGGSSSSSSSGSGSPDTSRSWSFGGPNGGGGGGGAFSGGMDVNDPSAHVEKTPDGVIGWKWSRPSAMGKQTLSEMEKASEHLLNLIEQDVADTLALQAAVAAVYQCRQAALARLPQAQQALREVVDSRQQAILALIGYL